MCVTFKNLMASTPGNNKFLLKQVRRMKSTVNKTDGCN
jgi:hypothetical protein